VVRREQLVAGGESARTEHRVHTARRVGHEREVVGVGADERGERRAGDVEPAVELAAEEPHRLGLHLRAQRGLVAQHLDGASAVRAVVQKGDAGIERPERGERRGVH
jgi:hypothetical protein